MSITVYDAPAFGGQNWFRIGTVQNKQGSCCSTNYLQPWYSLSRRGNAAFYLSLGLDVLSANEAKDKQQHSTLLFPSFSVSCCLHPGEERINLQVSADLVDSKLAFKIRCLLDQNQFFLRHHPPTISKMLLIIHSLLYMHCPKSLFILKILDMHSNSRIAFHTKKIGNMSP